jgi:hypothetical protein
MLRIAFHFCQTFPTLTDLLQHHFKLLQLFWRGPGTCVLISAVRLRNRGTNISHPFSVSDTVLEAVAEIERAGSAGAAVRADVSKVATLITGSLLLRRNSAISTLLSQMRALNWWANPVLSSPNGILTAYSRIILKARSSLSRRPRTMSSIITRSCPICWQQNPPQFLVEVLAKEIGH